VNVCICWLVAGHRPALLLFLDTREGAIGRLGAVVPRDLRMCIFTANVGTMKLLRGLNVYLPQYSIGLIVVQELGWVFCVIVTFVAVVPMPHVHRALQ